MLAELLSVFGIESPLSTVVEFALVCAGVYVTALFFKHTANSK